jgi:hypothetical protein
MCILSYSYSAGLVITFIRSITNINKPLSNVIATPYGGEFLMGGGTALRYHSTLDKYILFYDK